MPTSEEPAVLTVDFTRFTKEIVTAYLARTPVPSDELPRIIQIVHNSLLKVAGVLGQVTNTVDTPATESPDARRPAISIRKSVNDDYIVCLEDGKKLKMLKRHLRARYNLTPEAYREKWGLPQDYPMVAPAYARQRSSFAKSIGLGRGPKAKAERGPKK